MAAVKKRRAATPQENRAVQAARIVAAVTGGPDLNRAERRLVAKVARLRAR